MRREDDVRTTRAANALLIRAQPGERRFRRADRHAGEPPSRVALSSTTEAQPDAGAAGDFVLESRSLAGGRRGEGRLPWRTGEGSRAAPVLTYLPPPSGADRETPYSLVSGLPAALLPESGQEAGEDVLHPGPWLAEDLGLEPGDALELSFLVWEERGRFHSETASFVAGTPVAGEGLFTDQTLAPEFPEEVSPDG